MYLLNTDVVRSFGGPAKPPRQVLDWAASLDAQECYLSVITLLEIERDILVKERSDKVRAGHYRDWLNNDILTRYRERILPVDLTVSRRCARLHTSNSTSGRDALIAATALVHGMTIVTHNEADFTATGVPLFNPWSNAQK